MSHLSHLFVYKTRTKRVKDIEKKCGPVFNRTILETDSQGI